MGNVCSPQCATCQTVEQDLGDATFDLNAEDSLFAQLASVQQQSNMGVGPTVRPELPRLMLRTPRTSAKEKRMEEMAMAKVAALPHDVSSSSEWSVASAASRSLSRPSVTRPSKAHVSRPMGKLSEEDATKPPFMEIVFEAAGKDVPTRVYNRPVGAEFRKQAFGSIKVSKVFPESYAFELGVEVGWKLKSINGQSFANSSLHEAQNALMAGLEMLPCRAHE